ncbi:hypothetical protein BZZ01_00885 [Nostocales cyanobacterium HT-58-2]|nr:hypothetical protein BZZ01_00885 [Nostocales cyanobacterium HT-58-2]
MLKGRNLGKPFRHRKLLKKKCTEEAVFISCERENEIVSLFSWQDISYTLNFYQFKFLSLCFALNETLQKHSINTKLFQQSKVQNQRKAKKSYYWFWLSKIIIADKKIDIKGSIKFLNTGASTRSLVNNKTPKFSLENLYFFSCVIFGSRRCGFG